MVAGRPPVFNLRAARRAVQSLRRRGALDDCGELLAALLLSCGDLVDQVMAPESDVPAYARARRPGCMRP
jgi:hypothetical protein